jgi:DNA repair exonuclease SbcCD ATPase subunit
MDRQNSALFAKITQCLQNKEQDFMATVEESTQMLKKVRDIAENLREENQELQSEINHQRQIKTELLAKKKAKLTRVEERLRTAIDAITSANQTINLDEPCNRIMEKMLAGTCVVLGAPTVFGAAKAAEWFGKIDKVINEANSILREQTLIRDRLQNKKNLLDSTITQLEGELGVSRPSQGAAGTHSVRLPLIDEIV